MRTTSDAAPPAPAGGPPALSAQAWALLASVYLSQFVATGFFFVALITILRQQGAPLAQLSAVYLLGLVPALKFLWSPLLDRFGFGRHGHYRGWLLLMQAAIVATLVGISALDPLAQLPLVLAASALLALFTASQDIAADGLSCRLLSHAQRGLGNAVQMAGAMLGFMLGGGAMLMLYQRWGWRAAVLCMAAGSAITIVQLLAWREPAHARPVRLETASTSVSLPAALWAYWRQLGRFWQQPGTGWRWALLVVFFQLGICLAYGIVNPMLVDAGWSASRIGLVMNIYGSAASIPTILVVGLLIRRFGRRAVVLCVLPLQAASLFLLALPLWGHADNASVALAVITYSALYAPMGTVLATLMMDKASAHTPASDFAMQFGLSTFVGYAAAGAALPLAQAVGYFNVLVLASALTVAAAVLVGWLYRPGRALYAPTAAGASLPAHPHPSPARPATA